MPESHDPVASPAALHSLTPLPRELSGFVAALAQRYALERELGRGGMATVYLARDLKHDRRVALKVLNPELGAVLGVERFLAEIKVTANLQHPNLLPLFDSGEAAGLLFYVMPYVEGESLRARLERDKQLPVDEAIHIATAVASALDYAHRHHVIHRDLKPENILLHEGQPLVADFGIALAVSNAGGARITQTGLSLGTPQYMSPEQATGDRVINARTDIYSLGAVTYEMLVGDPPHVASTSQAVIAKVLTERPSAIRTSRPSAPEHVDAAVQRALEKLPADRFASAHEFADALTGKVVVSASRATHAASTSGDPLAARVLRGVPWVVAAAATVTAAIVWRAGDTDSSASALPVTRSTIAVPGSLRGPLARQIGVSPDGRTIAFIAGPTPGPQQIYVRRSDELESRALDGTEGATAITFSPNGESIGFVRRDSLLRIPVAGGRPMLVLGRGYSPHAPYWGSDDRILFARAGISASACYRVPAAGGPVDTLIKPAAGENCRFPELLPDGDGILYTLFRGNNEFEVRVLEVPERSDRLLVAPGRRAHYVTPGFILYQPDYSSVAAVPFDLRRKRLTGTPVPVLQDADQLEVSQTGTAIYRVPVEELARLFVTDGRSAPQQLPLPASAFRSVRFSPDGRRIVYGWGTPGTMVASGNISVADLALGSTASILPEGWVGADPFWSLDGSRITFLSRRAGTLEGDGFVVSADGGGPPRQLFKDSSVDAPQAWLPDGRMMARGDARRPGAQGSDLFVLSFLGDSVIVIPYLRADWNEDEPRPSPDGKWIAFRSSEAGRNEVYVRPFPDPSTGKWQISENGGHDPVWSRDGNTLYYWERQQLRAAHLQTRPTFSIVRRETVLTDSLYARSCCFPNYDVHPDGKRFIMARSVTARVAPEFTVVTNWFEELKARMTKRAQ
ncbi:MAG: protein kinase [Gemmatimonadaceae bacterium]